MCMTLCQIDAVSDSRGSLQSLFSLSPVTSPDEQIAERISPLAHYAGGFGQISRLCLSAGKQNLILHAGFKDRSLWKPVIAGVFQWCKSLLS